MNEVLTAPVITEKAMSKIADGRYTFKVALKVNKVQVAQAVADLYKVQVIKVNMICQKSQKVLVKGKFYGRKKAWKKAIVCLKKGQKITEFEEK